MGLGTKTVWKCDVCDHEWLSRDENKPLRCASCKTPYWNKSERLELSKGKQAKIRKEMVKESKR